MKRGWSKRKGKDGKKSYKYEPIVVKKLPPIFEFEGYLCPTTGKVMDAAIAIMREGDKERGRRFLGAYASFIESMPDFDGHMTGMEIVSSNIGYMSGYYEPETMRGIQEFYEVAHPIFGRAKNG